MMNDDEDCWWVEKKSVWGGEQEKGEMQLLAETCRPPRHAAKRPFFFPLRPTVKNYIARLPLCNVEPAGLALTAPMETALYTPAFYPSEILCFRNLRVGMSLLRLYTYSSACSTELRRRLRHLFQALSNTSNPNPSIGSARQ